MAELSVPGVSQQPHPTCFNSIGLELVVFTEPALLKIQNILSNSELIHSMTEKNNSDSMSLWIISSETDSGAE